MASIAPVDNTGKLWRIMYRDAQSKQQSLRLGQCSKRTAEQALIAFERLLESRKIGTTIHPDAQRWLAALDDRVYARVAKLGLVEPRAAKENITLGELIERVESVSIVKDGTATTYRQAFEALRTHFGTGTPIQSVKVAQAEAWAKAMTTPNSDGKTLASATIAKRVKVARALFKRALRWGLIEESPFDAIKAGSQANPERSFYVSLATIARVLEACPDDQWRGIIALSRFAGLRCPSEVALLRWGDVNWERSRLVVRSPKTAGHGEGHASRVVPMGPALREVLERLFENATDGSVYVIPRLRDPSTNLRTHFERIITKASEQPWPRLFHNLRASCATDWVERFPNHVVAKWLGHSPMIAASHYLQTNDAHFDLAAQLTGEDATLGTDQKAATKVATHLHAPVSTDEHDEDEHVLQPTRTQRVVSRNGNPWKRTQKEKTPAEAREMTPLGSEQTQETAAKLHVSATGSNKSSNVPADSGNAGSIDNSTPTPPSTPDALPVDEHLAQVIAAWPTLPDAMRRAVLALVQAAKG